MPVPECVDASGLETSCTSSNSIRLWPSNFHPASPIPSLRDSTGRVGGLSVPGEKSGHELFKALDIVTVNGVSRRLYAVYNAGIQSWDIGTNPGNPVRTAYRDGWQGHFLSFPPVSEQLNYTEDISAINNGTNDVVAAAGLLPVGPTFWEFNTATGQFRQLYQDTGTDATQIRLIKDNFGTIYGFASNRNGVAVYNVSAALGLPAPCLDDRGRSCAGVYRGLIPGQTLGYYIDVILKSSTNRIYVAAGDGFFLPIKIFELSNPNDPSSAVERFNGTGLTTRHRGVTLFSHGGHFYLAAVRDKKLDIYLADACLSGNNCSLATGSLEKAIDTLTISRSTWSPGAEFLDFSTTNGVNYLYYGVSTGNLEGPAIEGIFDLSNLRPPGTLPRPTLTEITSGAGTYLDPCSGATINYWSHYYARNLRGLRSMHPRHGLFAANGYFYRVGQSILDIHLLGEGGGGGGGGDQTVQVNVTSPAAPGPWWMNQPITFTASANPAANCSGGIWTWSHDDTYTGNPQTLSSTATVTFGFCPTSDCPDRNPLVSATSSACPDWTAIPEGAVTVKDPRPRIRPPIAVSPAGGVYDVGTPLTFTANVDGRNDATVPLNYQWNVFRVGEQVPLVSVAGQSLSVFDQWDTCLEQVIDPNAIFFDGFERGNLSAWTSTIASARTGVSTEEALASIRELLKVASSVDFRIELTASNSQGSAFDGNTLVTLVGTDPLAFGANGLQASAASQTDANGVTFTVDGTAAEVRWEVEDDDAACIAGGNCASVCHFYTNGCTVYDWGPASTNSQITHVWNDPNAVNSTRRVAVEIRKCNEGPLLRERSVTLQFVPTLVIPTVTDFRIANSSLKTSTNPNAPCEFVCLLCQPQEVRCKVGQSVLFSVTSDTAGVEYSFDWTGSGTFGSYTTSTSNTYSSPVATYFQPAVKARKGTGVSQARDLVQKIKIENF